MKKVVVRFDKKVPAYRKIKGIYDSENFWRTHDLGLNEVLTTKDYKGDL